MTRPRRDPRAERAALLVATGEGTRPRLDRGLHRARRLVDGSRLGP
jgi:electron transfer flavoprotein alpha subunit